MASDLENLKAIRSNLLATLVTNGVKPDYSIDGQSVTYSSLLEWIERLNVQITAAEGPWILDMYGNPE